DGTIPDTTGTGRVPFGFAGEYTETDRDLIYLRARFYDPATGQFLTRDPLEAVSGQPYLYAGGDPVNAIDPEGLLSISIPSLRDVSNAAAGFGDTASFGLTSKIRQAIGSDYVDYCAGAYTGGGLAGGAVGAATSVGAGVAALRAVRAGRAATAGAGAARPTFVAGDGTEIVGFTRHGINRAVGDGARRAGTRPEAILDAIKSPAKITEGVDDLGRPFKVYKGGDARVVINPDTGRIVSVNPRSGAGANR
uniref:RHS repeat-associated core domain-containing protein n=1 Tax=uncultured Arthrobacter sp. TaxID=114050 RepID=UPI003218032E